MKRLGPLTLLFLLAGCAMLDDYDSFYEGAYYEQPMPVQAAYLSPAPVMASCNGCDSTRATPHQAGYQTGEPPVLKQTAEPPK